METSESRCMNDEGEFGLKKRILLTCAIEKFDAIGRKSNNSMLHLVIGPMFAGKTLQVIRLARRFRAIGKTVLFVDHVSDNRYGSRTDVPTHLTSHDGHREQSLFIESLEELVGTVEYVTADVVVIEEAQFFSDLVSFVVRETDIRGKPDFVVSGLSGDFERNSIGGILQLIPHAEKVDVLHGLCDRCADGTPGCFTKRRMNTGGKILIGGKDEYECVCRRHYVWDD